MRTGPRFNRQQRSEIMLRISDGLLRQQPLYKIAQEIGISVSSAHRYQTQIEDAWRVGYLRRNEARKAQELAKLDLLERELWESWAKSLGIKRVNVVEGGLINPSSDDVFTIDPAPPELREVRDAEDYDQYSEEILPAARLVTNHTKETTEQLIGNPAYLAEIRHVIELRCKILGLEPVSRVEVDVRLQAERAARYLGLDPEDVIKRAEEIAARAFEVEGP